MPDDSAHGRHARVPKGDVSDVEAASLKTVPDGAVVKFESYTQEHVGKGTWYSAGWHLATTIATPAAYAPLPWAFAQLSWTGGIIALLMGTMVTYYNSLLLASLHEWDGNRHTRYRDLARSIFGDWGAWGTTFFQQVASLGNNITIQIVAGLAMQQIYLIYNPDGTMVLWQFILIFGVVELVLSQMPTIHSLRGLNLFSTMATLGFTLTATIMCIYNGYEYTDRSTVDYSVVGLDGSTEWIVYSAFSALGTVAFTFGDTVLPEVQATVKRPTERQMYKGISLCYSIISLTYFTIAIAGYWAFGNAVNPFVVDSFVGPSWAVTLTNLFAIIQIVGCYQIYTRPTYEFFEVKYGNHNLPAMAPRNAALRLFITSIYIAVVTTISAMIPFFGDMVALCGAIGFTPLDFILPVLMYLKVRRPARWVWCANSVLVIVYSIVAIVGAVGAMRFVVQHAVTYSLFANL